MQTDSMDRYVSIAYHYVVGCDDVNATVLLCVEICNL